MVRHRDGAQQGTAKRSQLILLLRHRIRVLLAAALMLTAASQGCGGKVDGSLTRAAEAWDAGNYKLAAEEYERYLTEFPAGDKVPEAHFQLANIYYFKLQRYDQARAHYSSVVEHSPGYPNVQLARERLAEVLG